MFERSKRADANGTCANRRPIPRFARTNFSLITALSIAFVAMCVLAVATAITQSDSIVRADSTIAQRVQSAQKVQPKIQQIADKPNHIASPRRLLPAVKRTGSTYAPTRDGSTKSTARDLEINKDTSVSSVPQPPRKTNWYDSDVPTRSERSTPLAEIPLEAVGIVPSRSAIPSKKTRTDIDVNPAPILGLDKLHTNKLTVKAPIDFDFSSEDLHEQPSVSHVVQAGFLQREPPSNEVEAGEKGEEKKPTPEKDVSTIAQENVTEEKNNPAVIAQQFAGDGGEAELNFGEDVEVKVLVDYVSQRLGINILYDEKVANKKLTIVAPKKVPVSTLYQLMQSALEMKGLVLIDALVPGWKRIVESGKSPIVRRDGEFEKFDAASAVTQIFKLQSLAPTKMDQVIKPLLTELGANSVVLEESGILIVTDYATNVQKIARLLEQIDRPKPVTVTKFLPLKHADAATLSQQVEKILTARLAASGKTSATSKKGIEVVHDVRTNQIMAIGSQKHVDEVAMIVQSLDVPLDLITEVYSPEYMPAERMEQLLKEVVIPSASDAIYKSVVDTDNNRVFVTATPQIHEKIAAFKKRIDVEGDIASKTRSPIQFYKLRNVSVEDLMETLRSIEENEQSEFQGPLESRDGVRTLPGWEVPGRNRPPTISPGPGRELPSPPAFRDMSESETLQSVSGSGGSPLSSIGLGRARISADPNTNTLIVIGEPSVQRIYEKLIQTLDRRRPQVLIEAKLVAIDASDDFSLGIEFSAGDRKGSKRLFSFTSFGLSGVDPVSGALSLIPGMGFNGALIDPDVADVVLRALSHHRCSRVLSAPKILVNDNATGILSSVSEIPFTSVNASQVVATTSFAGFAQAGTTITVTPHISEGDYLQLEYKITLNTFAGAGVDGIPPPRQTDEIESEITIPDGNTVIIGGLSTSNDTQDFNGLPFLERIPLIKQLTGITVDNSERTYFFVFLRPIILREDKFKTLKFLSKQDLHKASVTGDQPESQPLLIP